MYLAIWNGIQFLSVLFFQKDLGNRPPPRRRSNQVSRPVLANLELPVSFRAAVYLDIFGWHSGLPAFQEARGGSMGLVCETFTRSTWWFRTTFLFESTLEDFFLTRNFVWPKCLVGDPVFSSFFAAPLTFESWPSVFHKGFRLSLTAFLVTSFVRFTCFTKSGKWWFFEMWSSWWSLLHSENFVRNSSGLRRLFVRKSRQNSRLILGAGITVIGSDMYTNVRTYVYTYLKRKYVYKYQVSQSHSKSGKHKQTLKHGKVNTVYIHICYRHLLISVYLYYILNVQYSTTYPHIFLSLPTIWYTNILAYT